LASQIRRYKGVRPTAPVRPQALSIDGRFEDWKEVQPEYRDTIGDPVCRDYRGWGPDMRYVNRTGRNDLVQAKVSFDDEKVYFCVRTRENLSAASDPNWMLLLIDSDSSVKTGWLGYDWIVNRRPLQAGKAIAEANRGGEYLWDSPVEVSLQVGENELELAVPREMLGLTAFPAVIDFKWADNIRQNGQWSDFTLNGDVAPNDRFNYRARLESAN
jgi:hypothetical protein